MTAQDRPRPATEDLDEVVVVVAVRARQRVVQVGIPDHDVAGRAAHDVGVADVVERHVVDDKSTALREDAREAVLAAGELGVDDLHVAIVGVELQHDADVLLAAEEAHLAEDDVSRGAYLGDRRPPGRHDAQPAHDDAP